MRQIWKIPKQMKHRINNYESTSKATKITKWKGHKKELTVVFALSFLYFYAIYFLFFSFFFCFYSRSTHIIAVEFISKYESTINRANRSRP